jgi:MerR family transcriptional regulator, light-induced transcriptional regulator
MIMSTPELLDPKPLQIATVSDLLQIPVPTIRSWERRYGFPVPARTRGRHRRYSSEEVEQLRALRDAITHGYAAKEAVEIVRKARVGPTAGAPRVDALLRTAMDLDPNGARAVLDEAADSLGVEAAVIDVMLPAMQEVGSRWKAGTCDAANEHLLTDAVRKWLARMATLTTPDSRIGSVVLACGPRDLHTVGLEAFGLLLERRGRSVVMLGALTPLVSLRKAIEDTRASAAVVVAQRSVNLRSAVESLEGIHALLGGRAFYAGAAFSSPASRRGVPGSYLGTDMTEATRTVDQAIEGDRPSGTSRMGAG